MYPAMCPIQGLKRRRNPALKSGFGMTVTGRAVCQLKGVATRQYDADVLSGVACKCVALGLRRSPKEMAERVSIKAFGAYAPHLPANRSCSMAVVGLPHFRRRNRVPFHVPFLGPCTATVCDSLIRFATVCDSLQHIENGGQSP